MDGWTDVDIVYCGGQIPMLQRILPSKSSGISLKIIARTTLKSQNFFTLVIYFDLQC
jgi:hypothetical protein